MSSRNNSKACSARLHSAAMSLFTVQGNGELQPGVSQEWLLTNGTGAYSSSTVIGCNTRRYHGLLCAATLPPVGRIIALSRIDEILKIDGSETIHELSVNQFANNFHPHGERYLRNFELDDIAQWDFEVEGVKVTKQLQILWKRNTVAVRYTIDPAKHSRVAMQFLPFVALRDFHSLPHGTDRNFTVTSKQHEVNVSENNLTLNLRSDECAFVEA